MSAWVRIFIDVSSYSTRDGTDVARPSRACRPLCKSNLPSTRECHALHRTTGRRGARAVRRHRRRGARPDGGPRSDPSRTRGRRRRVAANAAGQRRRPEIGRHGPPLPAGEVRRLRSRYAERSRSPGRRGARLRVERLVPGPASHPQLHARAVARPGTARHLERGSGLPGERHLHFRRRSRPLGRRRLCAVGPLAAGERRQHQRLVPVRRPGRWRRRPHPSLFRPAAPRDRDRRYLAVGRPHGLGEQRRRRLGGLRSRPSHALDPASQGRSHARQCAQQEPALPHAELLHLRHLHHRRRARHRRGRPRILSRGRPPSHHAHLEPEGRRLSHAAGQGRRGIGGDRRRTAAPVRHMR